MKIIETLTDKIAEEIQDAKAYAHLALETRDAHPDLSRTLYELSTEEMDHMSRLHKAAEALIAQYRQDKGEPPADMLAVYNYMHKRQIDQAAEVKTLQAMYQ